MGIFDDVRQKWEIRETKRVSLPSRQTTKKQQQLLNTIWSQNDYFFQRWARVWQSVIREMPITKESCTVDSPSPEVLELCSTKFFNGIYPRKSIIKISGALTFRQVLERQAKSRHRKYLIFETSKHDGMAKQSNDLRLFGKASSQSSSDRNMTIVSFIASLSKEATSVQKSILMDDKEEGRPREDEDCPQGAEERQSEGWFPNEINLSSKLLTAPYRLQLKFSELHSWRVGCYRRDNSHSPIPRQLEWTTSTFPLIIDRSMAR